MQTSNSASKQAAPPHSRRRWGRRLFGLCLFVGLVIAFNASLLRAWARFLNISEPPRKSDYILVLGGHPETRPFAGAALQTHGYGNEVLITRSILSPPAEDGLVPPEHELTRQVLIKQGVDPERIIVLPGEFDSTQGEVLALAEFLKDKPDATVCVVTHAFHTRRARILFRRALKGQINQLWFAAAPTDGFDESNWWRVEEGAVTYVLETVKFLYTLSGRGD